MILLCTECVFYKTFVIDAQVDKADELISEIDSVYTGLLDKMAKAGKAKDNQKKLYKEIRTDLKEKVNSLGEKINKLD